VLDLEGRAANVETKAPAHRRGFVFPLSHAPSEKVSLTGG
jgi:hypothetical protein